MSKGAITWGNFSSNFKLTCSSKSVGVDCWGGHTVRFNNHFSRWSHGTILVDSKSDEKIRCKIASCDLYYNYMYCVYKNIIFWFKFHTYLYSEQLGQTNKYYKVAKTCLCMFDCRMSRRSCMGVQRHFWLMLNGFFTIASSSMDVSVSFMLYKLSYSYEV